MSTVRDEVTGKVREVKADWTVMVIIVVVVVVFLVTKGGTSTWPF